MFSRILVAVILVTALATACGSMLYVPTEQDAQATGIPLDSLQEGRRLYANRCSGCHNLYLPNSHTQTEWAKITGEMTERSKLQAGEARKIVEYLGTGAKGTTGRLND